MDPLKFFREFCKQSICVYMKSFWWWYLMRIKMIDDSKQLLSSLIGIIMFDNMEHVYNLFVVFN